MEREIIDHFLGKDNVIHLISDNGNESYLTLAKSFSDEVYRTGACKLNTVETEKKHVLFLFNEKN